MAQSLTHGHPVPRPCDGEQLYVGYEQLYVGYEQLYVGYEQLYVGYVYGL